MYRGAGGRLVIEHKPNTDICNKQRVWYGCRLFINNGEGLHAMLRPLYNHQDYSHTCGNLYRGKRVHLQ